MVEQFCIRQLEENRGKAADPSVASARFPDGLQKETRAVREILSRLLETHYGFNAGCR